MSVPVYFWDAESQFVGREESLNRMDQWWNGTDAEPINLFGRRRVGKSWLFRKFAHGRQAIVLVAESTTPAQQMAKLAEQLEPFMQAKPEIKDIATLFRILYQLAKTEKLLVVIDEFPYLLGTTQAENEATLSSVQAVMEQYRDQSKIKLILCGSAIAQMEALQGEKSPLHGRLMKFELLPLTFAESRPFFEGNDVIDQLTRYSVTGGMPRYLSMLGNGDFTKVLVEKVVDRNAPLFNEVQSLLQSELRETSTYFAVLSQLAIKPKDSGSIGEAIGKDTSSLTNYLANLEAMRLLKKKNPVGADPKSRSIQWECDDGFIRFWFRFVAPYRADLEAGGDARSHVTKHIIPFLSEHTSPEFEHVFRRWIRQQYESASRVGGWWGNALNEHRKTGLRSTEEIDAVGIASKKVVVVGEAKWTNALLGIDVLTDLLTHKIPALNQGALNTPNNCKIVLTSRSGFTDGVKEAAALDANIRLVLASDLLAEVR